MIYLIKSINKSILGKAKFKHWAFLDTQKQLIYSYEYDIVGNKFKNGKVKRYTYEEYDKIVDSEVTYTKLKNFNVDDYLFFTHEKATCIDFCLGVMEQEKIRFSILRIAYEAYLEVIRDIKRIGISHFIAFGLGFLFGILIFLIIMKSLFDIQFIF